MSGHSKWSNIKHKKGANDAKRAKVFTKLGKELTIAAKEAGGNPTFNPRLRLAIDKAKAANMPKDVLDRAIKKGTGELEGVDYVEIRYEGYGPEGTAFIVDVVTDNRNRSASEVRSTFSKKGGNLGTDGAVSWMFQKKGEILLDSEGLDYEEFMMEALEAGADDIIDNDGEFQVLTDPTELQTVAENLKTAGFTYTEAEIGMIPDNKVNITDLDLAKKVMTLYEALEDLDDVNDVYVNFDIADDLLEQL
ncbi:MAG: YebC/PmpR family DNA-binding transcriptional regulator [Cetobacterium sp.]|uniref:Probable transcriptional regulatory protein SAMN02745174_00018 n=1 Tax=Cetobacterium ceti TaxID=180163 RepID=A0A1T4JRQ7_9FUSO|nr:YebC/PmpR family DNA-binding transcriptional regulator [Cetobacterium ceti]MCJ8342073.1 YebC/PmpR family DNA-binding transcriptional regulator [Cetobacterium sp.]SJZ32819.1 DNA-binding regulatory protein, YebC/PmpR family [Cetobacterium ceti]